MTDHPTTAARDLYAAILREPSCDLVRLAYADEIDGAGECERAEFIRVQIELAKHPKHKYLPDWHDGRKSQDCWYDCARCRLERRDAGLFRDHDWDELPPGINGVTYRRGFVDSIAMTMQAFVGGGECRTCEGTRFLGTMEEDEEYGGERFDACHACHGTGRTPGLASVICAKWPVMSVTFSDKRPFPYGRDPDNRWGWFRMVGQEYESTIHNDLWKLLSGHTVYVGRPHAIKWYPNREAAHLALSRAAVAYARELAGLPALKYANSTQPVAV